MPADSLPPTPSPPATDTQSNPPPPAAITPAAPGTRRTNRVFITHGKNHEIVSQLKEMLTFGGFTPVVSIESETISKPVPDKVMDDMRSCDAAVIHVGEELKLMGQDGTEHRMLIEIGAAMALYGRKFILLVEKGMTLPPNLQGLYEVRHEGGKLDYDSTMRLLKPSTIFDPRGKVRGLFVHDPDVHNAVAVQPPRRIPRSCDNGHRFQIAYGP